MKIYLFLTYLVIISNLKYFEVVAEWAGTALGFKTSWMIDKKGENFLTLPIIII